MGINRSSVKVLIRESPQFPPEFSVLTLGVPKIYTSYEETVTYFNEYGIKYCEIPALERKKADDLFWNSNLQERQYIHPETFFKILGAKQYSALDVFDFEGASIIHDLNQPIPKEYYNSFDVIIDCGTTSHVPNTLSVFENVTNMLKINGIIIHILGIAGFVNHGFYQISPLTFYEYYGSNGFTDLKSYIFRLKKYDPRGTAKCFEYKYCPGPLLLENITSCAFIFFMAKKVEEHAQKTIPIQGRYLKKQSESTGKSSNPPALVSGNIVKRWVRVLKSEYKLFMLLYFLYRRFIKERIRYYKL